MRLWRNEGGVQEIVLVRQEGRNDQERKENMGSVREARRKRGEKSILSRTYTPTHTDKGTQSLTHTPSPVPSQTQRNNHPHAHTQTYLVMLPEQLY